MEPITRKEKFLAKAGGQNIELPNPVTREEMFLAAIGGTSGGRGWVERKEVTFECDAAVDNVLEGFPLFAVGDTVNVKVDGVEYSLVVFEDSDSGFPVIGDKPEYVMTGEGGEYGWFIGLTPEAVLFCTTQNRTVSYDIDVVHKIDKKFLSNSHILYAGGSGSNLYHDIKCTDGVTKEQLMSMVGDIVWVMYESEFMLCISISDYGAAAKAVLYDNRMCYTIEYNPW